MKMKRHVWSLECWISLRFVQKSTERLDVIQLFWGRLSNKTILDNAERYYGEWGSWSLIEVFSFRCFSDIKGKSTNKCIYACSCLVGKYLEPQSIDAITCNTNCHCRVRFYAFVEQPLSKQLCIKHWKENTKQGRVFLMNSEVFGIVGKRCLEVSDRSLKGN